MKVLVLLPFALLLSPLAILAQTQPAVAPPPAPAADNRIEAAESLIGQALFLRGFFSGDDLTFDASGKVAGTSPTGSWTLAAMDVQKVERRSPDAIQLDGVRVALRYNQDQHLFERHPLKNEKLQVTIADTGDVKVLQAALKNIFAIGIDLPLQRSMPDFWVHYFNPGAPWPADSLTGKTILPMGPTFPAGATPPSPVSAIAPTVAQTVDRVRGVAQVRMVVDEEGVPRHVALFTPLGSDADHFAIETAKALRFHPAMAGGKPTAARAVIDVPVELPAPAKPRPAS